MITRERILELLEYRPETGQLFWRKRAGRVAAGTQAGCVIPKGYRIIRLDRRLHFAHRLVYFLETGEWVDRIDHKDGVEAGDHFTNLRPCTSGQNLQNQQKRSGTASAYKGVTTTRHGRWAASITVARKRLHLGHFDNETAAARAYDAAAIKHFGEFARLNFPVTN